MIIHAVTRVPGEKWTLSLAPNNDNDKTYDTTVTESMKAIGR